MVGYKPVNLGRDRHRAAGERLPRRHRRQALRRPVAGHVHRRADRRRQRAADALASRRRRRRTRSCATTRSARSGRGGRARPDAPARCWRWSPCRASTRTRWSATTPTRPQAAYNKLEQDPDKPLLNRALSETYPPGSTFKVIVVGARRWRTASARTPQIPAGPSYTAPDTDARRSATPPGVDLPGAQVTLIEALTESCNTGFAQLGVRARRGQAQGDGAGSSASSRRT